jgi:hypothetical protein
MTFTLFPQKKTRPMESRERPWATLPAGFDSIRPVRHQKKKPPQSQSARGRSQSPREAPLMNPVMKREVGGGCVQVASSLRIAFESAW